MLVKFTNYLVMSLFLFMSVLSYAQKTDTVIHINHNILTGEIKKVIDGILYFKMDGMGTIPIEAEKIRTYTTRKKLQIRLKSGELLFGTIDTSLQRGYVKVGYGVNKETVSVLDIVEVFPIKSTFWLRVTGNFDFGLDYSKSTDILRSNTSGRLDYRKEKIYTAIYWNSYFTMQDVTKDSVQINEKMDYNFDFKGFIKGKWLYVGRLGVNSNQELGLNARIFLGAGIQNDLIYTTRNHFYWQFGGNFNREYNDDGTIIENPEALLSASYIIYKYSRPEISLSANVSMFPNLTFNGRWRLDTDLQLKIELFYNFYVGFKIYTNYDSKPNVATAANNDWGAAFSLGYSFH
jgi:hypothetical protein